jgi:hypothetical protein
MSFRKQLDYQIVTLGELEEANEQTIDELERHGFYDERMAAIEVYLALAADAFGWQNYGGNGRINVPAVSLARLRGLIGYEKASLRDVLRHEYAHALADTHRGLMRSRKFSTAFRGSHASETESGYDKTAHVTRYAAASPGEDFAEVFMKYLKHGGRIPKRFRTPLILRKWEFIRKMAAAIRAGKRRW